MRTAWDGVACPAPAGPHAPRAAERVVVARRGFTALDDAVRPLAVGIAGDRITWTGDPAQAGDAAHPIAAGAAVDDWGEAFLMPGFHDAHLHFFHAALYASPLADQFLGTSEQDCVDRLADLAARRPAGSWLLAQGWREYRWDPPVTPTRASLDAVYPDRPVALYSGDAHTLWLNSCALERLGITEDAEPPAGGSYDRGADGRLTGIVREAAAMELMPRIVGSFSAEELLDAYRAFQATLNAQGLTAVCDLALMAGPGLDFVRDDLFAALEDAGELTLRVSLFPTLLAEGSRLADLQARLRGPLVRAQGYKQFFDGVSSQHTAWLRDPYANARFPGDCGRPTVAPAVMSALVQRAVAEGQGVRIHAIGDEAIHVALDLYERAGAARPGGGAPATDCAPDPAASPIAPAARRAPDSATAPAA
ncbi:amidohydrolase, partial [Enterorhabdus sp. P55]|nr:amidohydrolase [Enterorhabdus sp. P55]